LIGGVPRKVVAFKPQRYEKIRCDMPIFQILLD